METGCPQSPVNAQRVSAVLRLDASAFLPREDVPLLDARSPREYARGHIPGARSFPLFSDDEYARVGAAYARSGKESALHLALTLIGPQLAVKLARARALLHPRRSSPGAPQVRIYCSRGGMRSASLAWLLELGDIRVAVLEGGYQAYRRQVHADLARPRPILILGGMTGSGKTDVLHALAALGEQVIDLEALAGHRGSAFGAVGLPEQPSGEAMENQLHFLWTRLDPARPVWVEDEDRRIGGIALNGDFFSLLRSSSMIRLDLPFELRVRRLARVYAGRTAASSVPPNTFAPAATASGASSPVPGTSPAGPEAPLSPPDFREALADCVRRLEKRLGSEKARNCRDAIFQGRYEDAARLVLPYYDALYARQMEGRLLAFALPLGSDEPARAARLLLEQVSIHS